MNVAKPAWMAGLTIPMILALLEQIPADAVVCPNRSAELTIAVPRVTVSGNGEDSELEYVLWGRVDVWSGRVEEYRHDPPIDDADGRIAEGG